MSNYFSLLLKKESQAFLESFMISPRTWTPIFWSIIIKVCALQSQSIFWSNMGTSALVTTSEF